MPSISVIICVKNQKYELRKSLLSVYEQTEKPFEIIIVDASDNDEVYTFIEKELKENVKYMHLPETSSFDLSDRQLFELGIKNSAGDYSALMFSGDVWKKEKLFEASRFISDNADTDFLISSYTQRICLSDRQYMVEDYPMEYLPCFALFQYWSAPSSVVVKNILAMALMEFTSEDVARLKIGVLNKVLSCHYYGAGKDSLATERFFWNGNYSQISRMKLIQEAVLYCIMQYQNDKKSKDSLEVFANNVSLQPSDVVKVVYGIKDFTKEVVKDSNTDDLNKKQQNYILMRTWLESKIEGKSIGENLRNQNIRRIAIYGAGKHGTILYNDLKDSAIEIKAWLDKSPKTVSYLGLPVYTVDEFIYKHIIVDAVIITPFMEFESIISKLKEKLNVRCISLKDLIISC